MQFEHDDALRSAIRRARITKVDDKGDFQLVNLKGLKNEAPEKIYRPMDFGFFSMPPDDTHGVMIQMGGRSDRTLYFDGGHKDYRPKERPAGSSGLFDQYGNLFQTEKDQVGLTHKKKVSIQLGDGYSAKDAAKYSGSSASIVIEPGKITIKKAGTTVVLEDNRVLVEGASEASIGASGGYVHIDDSGKVHLAASGPWAKAPNQVITTAGPSSKVFAEI